MMTSGVAPLVAKTLLEAVLSEDDIHESAFGVATGFSARLCGHDMSWKDDDDWH